MAPTVVMPIIPEEAHTHSSLIVAPPAIHRRPAPLAARSSHPRPASDSSGEPATTSAPMAEVNEAKAVETVLHWRSHGSADRRSADPLPREPIARVLGGLYRESVSPIW